MRTAHSVLSLDIIFFFLFLMFVLGFIVNVFKKIQELAGRDMAKQKPFSAPAAGLSGKNDREQRIQRERDELKYGFPMPRPARTWVKPQPVIQKYAPEKTIVTEKAGAPDPQPAEMPQEHDTSGWTLQAGSEGPRKDFLLEEILKGRDLVTQGIVMSIILNPPRSKRRDRAL